MLEKRFADTLWSSCQGVEIKQSNFVPQDGFLCRNISSCSLKNLNLRGKKDSKTVRVVKQ